MAFNSNEGPIAFIDPKFELTVAEEAENLGFPNLVGLSPYDQQLAIRAVLKARRGDYGQEEPVEMVLSIAARVLGVKSV